jgi:hypothetical protein
MLDAELREAVGRAVGVPVREVGNVERVPVAYDAFLAGRSITRIRGMADTAGGRVAWTVIEKVTAGPDHASPYLYDNGLREYLAYESGLLDDLGPSIAAPLALHLDRPADGTLTLWLEDLDAGANRLAVTDVLAAARDLGRFAGHWIDRAPGDSWLFHGWLDRHSQPEAIEPARVRFRQVRGAPTIESRLGWQVDRAMQLIADQPMFRAVLEALPQTLCHHDAVGANVFRRCHGGSGQTVLIDWESVGPGPIGADLASLLFSSARRGDIPATAVPELLDGAIGAYAEGLRSAGRAVELDELRLGVDAAIGLRWVLARDVITALADGTPVRRGSAPGEGPEEALAQLIALTRVLLDSAAAVRHGATVTPPTAGTARERHRTPH